MPTSQEKACSSTAWNACAHELKKLTSADEEGLQDACGEDGSHPQKPLSLPSPINRVIAEMRLSAYFDYSFQIPLQLDPRENSALSSDECNFLFT